MIDVSAQDSCAVTPINPTTSTLIATGGVLASGTVNVTIECRCPNSRIRWFDPNNTRLLTKNNTVPHGAPYVDVVSPALVILVIPTFSDSYNGTYTCGIGNNYPPQASTTVGLYVASEYNDCITELYTSTVFMHIKDWTFISRK